MSMLGRPRTTLRTGACLVVVAHLAAACSRGPGRHTASGTKMNGPLIAASATMVAAWEFPKNPLVDASLDTLPLSEGNQARLQDLHEHAA